MNILTGIIDAVVSEGQLSIVKIMIGNDVFSSIIIDAPKTAKYLTVGTPVNLVFKENEVVVAKEFTGGISMQNRFNCTVLSLEMGKLLCRVVLNYNNHTIVSLITANAATQLKLSSGDNVTAMVKTNEISLAHD